MSELDNVAWNEFFGINLSPLSVTKADAYLSLHFFESIECAVSVAVLPDGNNGVEHKDEKDYEGFHVGSQTFITVTYFKSKCGQTKFFNVKTEPRMLENKRVKFEARSDCFARAFMTDTKMIALA